MPDQKPFLGVPSGEVKAENPDGITWSNNGDPKTNLSDVNTRPAITSGDWKVRAVDVRPRGRP